MHTDASNSQDSISRSSISIIHLSFLAKLLNSIQSKQKYILSNATTNSITPGRISRSKFSILNSLFLKLLLNLTQDN